LKIGHDLLGRWCVLTSCHCCPWRALGLWYLGSLNEDRVFDGTHDLLLEPLWALIVILMSATCSFVEHKVVGPDCPPAEIPGAGTVQEIVSERPRSYSRYSFNTSYCFNGSSSLGECIQVMTKEGTNGHGAERHDLEPFIEDNACTNPHCNEAVPTVLPIEDAPLALTWKNCKEESVGQLITDIPLARATNQWSDLDSKQRDRLVRSNIPPELVEVYWTHISTADVSFFPNLFDKLCRTPCDHEVEEKILKDVGRTFQNETVKNMQTKLYCVLKAYSLYDPRVGYCQVWNCIQNVFYFTLFAGTQFFGRDVVVADRCGDKFLDPRGAAQKQGPVSAAKHVLAWNSTGHCMLILFGSTD
jgi:hypothetical protein